MALEDAWVFLKDEGHPTVEFNALDWSMGARGQLPGWHSMDGSTKRSHISDAQKKVGDMLTKDLGVVDWGHNAAAGNHSNVHEHIEHAIARAQMRMHAINAEQLHHPCLKGDKWFYMPKFFNDPRAGKTGFSSPTGNMFDEGEHLPDLVRGTTKLIQNGHQAFVPGGIHHIENQPEGLGAKRPPQVGPRENYPEHADPGFLP